MTVVLASVVTGVFTLAAAFSTLWHQRDMAQDERLWSRRAETYLALLQYQGMGVIEGIEGLPRWENLPSGTN